MPTLREWLAEFAAEEGTGAITAVQIGSEGSWGSYHMDQWPQHPTNPVSMNDITIQAALDHEFSDGYGDRGCPGVHAWSEGGWVFAIACYDGSTGWFKIPTRPRLDDTSNPIMPGGG